MLSFHHKRALSIIQSTIDDLQLDLAGIEVLTEVGSNNYIYTPIIAAMAGATRVNAWTKDSSYGKGELIKAACFEVANYADVADRINIEVNRRPADQIASADLITNSGVLRPIDQNFLQHVKQTTVIPLMYEAWEYRKEDVDGVYCKSKGVKIAGTWEHHPSIRVFEKIGALSLKLAFEAGFEVAHNKILIWSDDNFGKEAFKAFNLMEPEKLLMTTDPKVLLQELPDLDFIFICDYDEERQYFGNQNSIFEIETILSLNNKVGVVHLYGNVGYEYLIEKGLGCYPKKNGKAKIMSETLAYLGLLPVLKLQTAGFKVGEALFRGVPSELKQELTLTL